MSKLSYTLQGDYNLPNLCLSNQPQITMGHYARLRRSYLRKHHRVLYYNLLTQGKLVEHLAGVEQRAVEMEETLLKQIVAAEGLTERFKASTQMSWAQQMNNLRNRVREIVRAEVISSLIFQRN